MMEVWKLNSSLHCPNTTSILPSSLLTFDMFVYGYRRNYVYWSDARMDQIFRSNLDGSAIMFLANATHEDIGVFFSSIIHSANMQRNL